MISKKQQILVKLIIILYSGFKHIFIRMIEAELPLSPLPPLMVSFLPRKHSSTLTHFLFKNILIVIGVFGTLASFFYCHSKLVK